MKKTILCYGDSNTRGYVPQTGRRHSFEDRWPGVLQHQLHSKIRVIEEGLNGRTTVYDDPQREGRNGASTLAMLIESHTPIDIMVIMLGTNDIYNLADISAADAANGVAKLIDLTRSTCQQVEYSAPTILIISPPLALPLTDVDQLECVGDPSRSHDFAHEYKRIADKQKCLYLDAAKVVTTSDVDNVHLDAQNHHKLGKAVAECLLEVI